MVVVLLALGGAVASCSSAGGGSGDSYVASNSADLASACVQATPHDASVTGSSSFARDSCKGTEYGSDYTVGTSSKLYYESWDGLGCVAVDQSMVAVRSWRGPDGRCYNDGTPAGSTSGTWYTQGGSVNRDYCTGTPGGWIGCHTNGCSVCSELVANYPLYYANHPHCVSNDSCGPGPSGACNSNCPPPSAGDLCDGTAGQWRGCHDNGCAVCSDLVVNYPYYWYHHPSCSVNESCGGVTAYHGLCNARCPAPTEADTKP